MFSSQPSSGISFCKRIINILPFANTVLVLPTAAPASSPAHARASFIPPSCHSPILLAFLTKYVAADAINAIASRRHVHALIGASSRAFLYAHSGSLPPLVARTRRLTPRCGVVGVARPRPEGGHGVVPVRIAAEVGGVASVLVLRDGEAALVPAIAALILRVVAVEGHAVRVGRVPVASFIVIAAGIIERRRGRDRYRRFDWASRGRRRPTWDVMVYSILTRRIWREEGASEECIGATEGVE